MSPRRAFYITTTIPYVNADPHIGFALELVQSDTIARYQRLLSREVFFSTGTDEHGQKIWEAAEKQGKPVQEYVDHYATQFIELSTLLNISHDNFIRTTNKEHIKAAQEMWRLCEQKGDIYKKKYSGLYCVGCERFITEKDLVDGKCEFHPTLTPETVEEENYFFKLSNYREQLREYLKGAKSAIPEWKRDEALQFVEHGMEDFSISRDKKRFAWGVPVPGDESQVMYVWFDALVNYISTLGWPREKEKFEKFWQNGENIQTAGKDMVKFQSVMWQGMLMSAGLSTTEKVVYHGFITGEGGVRMSKSLGNVINPKAVVEEYGTDALRYFLLREVSPFEDSPFTMERFKEAYNANLANGLGNLASRVMTMAVNNDVSIESFPTFNEILEIDSKDGDSRIITALNSFDLKKVMDLIWFKIQISDQLIQLKKPFSLVKDETTKAEGLKSIKDSLLWLYQIAVLLQPFLPDTAKKIQDLIKENKKPEKPLFLRKD